MDHDAGDGIRGRLSAWMQRYDLSYRVLCFRAIVTFAFAMLVVQTAQKRGILVGLVALVAFAPFLIFYWRREPFSSTLVVRNKAVATIHVTLYSFAITCLIFPWSTATCALVTVTLIGLTAIADLGWRRWRSRQAH